jgi:hypothetical protein
MPRDLIMNLGDQELVCLELMCRGEDMLAIGIWESPIKRLAMKELAVKVGNGYRITDKGRAEFARSEGVEVETVKALEPPRPDWIVTPLEGEPPSLVILRKNELAVSGYEAMEPAHFRHVAHGQMNDADTVAVRGYVDGLLQAMLDAAWKRGLRPNDP